MFAGRQWRISIEATQAYVLEHIHLSYWWILLVGMMFSCLAALYLGNVLSRQEKAEALVAERTRELLAEKQLSDDIINSLPGAFYLYNEQGKFLRWNKNLEQTSGYSHDEVAQMTPVDFFVGEEKIRLRQAIIESFRTGENVFEATAQVRGGNLIPFLFTNLRIDYNGVPCIIGMGLDISERKQAEEALERTREQLAEGQRIAHLGSWEYLAATGTTFWSDEEKRIFGLDPAQPSPTYEILLRDHIHPEDAAEMDRIFHKALEQGTSFEKEHRVIRPDGTVRWAYSKAKPYFDEHGKLLRYIGTSLDITDRKQAEAELEKARAAADAANRAKTDFLATMSHEFRTPLNAIIGFSEILADQLSGPLNDKQARQVGHILTGGRHLLSLVNDILDLAKVESGKMELSLTAVNLSTLINGSLLVIRERALHHAIRLEVDLEPDLTELTINADERKLKQIMFNLLSNAVKYTPEEGEIKVGGKKSDGTIQISVSDTGIGILPEDQERIFGSFEQVNSSLSLQQEGTGLGLALTRRLVELHGGKIWVESNGNGPGSVFCFTIPLEAATAAQESEDS